MGEFNEFTLPEDERAMTPRAPIEQKPREAGFVSKYMGGEAHFHSIVSNLPENDGSLAEIPRHEADYPFDKMFDFIRKIIDKGTGLAQYIVFAEHPSDSARPEKMISPARAQELLAHFEKIRHFNQQKQSEGIAGQGIEGPRMVAGLEADIVSPDGEVNVPELVLAECELVIASKHSLGDMFKDQEGKSREPNASELTQMYLGLMRNPHIDMIGHLNRYVPEDTLRAMDWQTLFDEAIRTRTILEINAGAPMPPWLIKEAVKHGVPLMIGTDAHDLMRYRNLPEERSKSMPEASFGEIQDVQKMPEVQREASRARRLQYGPGLHYWWKLVRPLKALDEAGAPEEQVIGSSRRRLDKWIGEKNKFEREITWDLRK